MRYYQIIVVLCTLLAGSEFGCSTLSGDKRTVSITMRLLNDDVQQMRYGKINCIEWLSGYIHVQQLRVTCLRDQLNTVNLEKDVQRVVFVNNGEGMIAQGIDVPVGLYSGVDVEINAGEKEGQAVLALEGKFIGSNGKTVPVLFELNDTHVFHFSSTAHTIDLDKAKQIEVIFRPSLWFSAITDAVLQRAVQENGVVVINERSNPELYSFIIDQLDGFGELFIIKNEK